MDGNSQALCSPPGRPDIYGVGIRAAFYIQWLGSLIIEYVSEEHLADMRFVSIFSSAAASIALVIGVAHGQLQPLDMYFLLLFGIGFFLFFVPLHAWRLLTKCHPQLDPFLLTSEVHGMFYLFITFTILTAVAAMGAWYYTTFLPRLGRDCRDVVFLFGKMDLQNKAYVVAGSVFYIATLVIIGLYIFMNSCFSWSPPPDGRYRRVRKRHIQRLRTMRVLTGLVIFILLVLAIELPISWNRIESVSEFGTLGQLIPFFLSIGLFLRSWAMYMSGSDEGDQNENETVSTPMRESQSTDEVAGIDQYYQGYDYGDGYENGYGNWPEAPQWPPGVYFSAR
ncbi:hypothetical protein FDECE_9434 [Fusarium decemcellulare]|nr:hypothetical protein FDECE_9434 [Fusarium decemcellulare]